MIKKGMMVLLILLMSSSLILAATNSVIVPTSNSAINAHIEIVRYSPNPVEPGEYFDLWVAVTPIGTSSSASIISLSDLQGVEIELVEAYPFSLNQDDEAVQNIGTLEIGEEAVRQYKIRVADDATFDEGQIQFIYRSNEDSDTQTPELDIAIESLDTTLSIVSIETTPEKLVPGQEATIEVKVENDASVLFKNLQAVLDVDGTSVPIVPYKATKEQTLSKLYVGDSYTFSYSVIVEENAKSGVYKVPIKIEYRDLDNTAYSRNDTFGLLVGSDADLAFNLEEYDTFQEGLTGEFVVSVSNIGPSDVKFLTIELMEGDGYTLLGPSKEYLGNIDSDDFETSRFNVYVDNIDDVDLNFGVSYKDTYNEEMEETFSLALPVYSATEVGKYGLDGNGKSYATYIIYIILLLVVYYFIKGWKLLGGFEKGITYAIKQTIKLPFRVLFFFSPRRVALWPKKIRAFFKDV
jgi:hypothetical protein